MSVTTPPPLKAFEGGGVVKCFLFSGLQPELKEGGKRGEGGGGAGAEKLHLLQQLLQLTSEERREEWKENRGEMRKNVRCSGFGAELKVFADAIVSFAIKENG